MRVAVITTGFAANRKDYNGAAAILNTIMALSKMPDIGITVFSLYYPCNQLVYEIDSVKVYSFIEGRSLNRASKPAIWRDTKEKFGIEHRRKPFDLIHAMWAGESGHVAASLGKRFGVPLIANINGGELASIPEISFGSQLKLFQRRFVNRTLKQASAIVCGSDYMLRLLEKLYRQEHSAKSQKIPFGVDTRLFKKQHNNRKNEAPVFINVANAVPVKAHNILFDSFRKVLDKYPNAVLRCFGKDESNTLRVLAKSAGILNNIELNGFTEYEQIPHVLSEADIFVLSSLYESQNMALLEAAFCGLTAVSTNVGIAPEVTKYNAPPGNAESLAAMMIKAVEVPSTEYTGLEERFSLESSAEKFYGLYKSLCK